MWLNRPPANPLSPQVIGELTELWEEIDGKLRAVVFACSNIFTFSAGADIKEFTKMSPDKEGRELIDSAHALHARDGAVAHGHDRRGQLDRVRRRLRAGDGVRLPPGGGVGHASASRRSTSGIIPGFGGTQRLPRLVGEAKALEMNLVGDPIGAYEALRLGLANQVVPDHELFDTALAWARKLAGQAPLAVEQIKRVSAARRPGRRASRPRRQGFAAAFGSEDAKEGIGAFLGKRQPKFQGK